jgi:uncharacterized SAM-binding protein YcdF (DUF218 family)
VKFSEWIERHIVIDDDTLSGVYDAAIGIGIDTTPDGRNASPHSEAVAWKCRELLLSGYVRHILFTGGYYVSEGRCEAETMWAVIAAQTPHNLFLELTANRTYGNADATRGIAEKNKWQRVIVVAQQLHARRVKATFAKRWAGSGIEIAVVKAWGQYTQNCSQRRLRSFWNFLLWDSLSFLLGKLKGWN